MEPKQVKLTGTFIGTIEYLEPDPPDPAAPPVPVEVALAPALNSINIQWT